MDALPRIPGQTTKINPDLRMEEISSKTKAPQYNRTTDLEMEPEPDSGQTLQTQRDCQKPWEEHRMRITDPEK